MSDNNPWTPPEDEVYDDPGKKSNSYKGDNIVVKENSKKDQWTPPADEVVSTGEKAKGSLFDMPRAEGTIDTPKGGSAGIEQAIANEKPINDPTSEASAAKKNIKLSIDGAINSQGLQTRDMGDNSSNWHTPDMQMAPEQIELLQRISVAQLQNPYLSESEKADVLDFADKYIQTTPQRIEVQNELNKNPDNIDALNRAGNIYSVIGDDQSARNFYNKSLGIMYNPEAKVGLAGMDYANGKKDEALSQYHEVIDFEFKNNFKDITGKDIENISQQDLGDDKKRVKIQSAIDDASRLILNTASGRAAIINSAIINADNGNFESVKNTGKSIMDIFPGSSIGSRLLEYSAYKEGNKEDQNKYKTIADNIDHIDSFGEATSILSDPEFQQKIRAAKSMGDFGNFFYDAFDVIIGHTYTGAIEHGEGLLNSLSGMAESVKGLDYGGGIKSKDLVVNSLNAFSNVVGLVFDYYMRGAEGAAFNVGMAAADKVDPAINKWMMAPIDQITDWGAPLPSWANKGNSETYRAIADAINIPASLAMFHVVMHGSGEIFSESEKSKFIKSHEPVLSTIFKSKEDLVSAYSSATMEDLHGIVEVLKSLPDLPRDQKIKIVPFAAQLGRIKERIKNSSGVLKDMLIAKEADINKTILDITGAKVKEDGTIELPKENKEATAEDGKTAVEKLGPTGFIKDALKVSESHPLSRSKGKMPINNQYAGKRVVEMVAKSIKKAFPSLEVITDSKDFISAAEKHIKSNLGADSVVFDQKRDGYIVKKGGQETIIKSEQVTGFNDKNKSYVNPEYAKMDTPVHEFGAHPWINSALEKSGLTSLDQIMSADPSELNNYGKILRQGLDLIEGSSYDIKTNNNKFYSGGSRAHVLEEALAQAIGENGIALKSTASGKFGLWLHNLVGDLFQGKDVNPDMTLGQYLDAVSKDIFGKEKLESDRSASEPNKDTAPKPNNEPLKQNQNAIQEQGTGSVLPRQQETVGEAGGERVGVGQGEQGKEVAKTGKEEVVEVPNAPKGNFLNIGMLEGKENKEISKEEILSKLPSDIKVESADRVEGTEPSLSIKTDRPLTDSEMEALLKDTKQMAIPQLSDRKGKVHGSKEWGEFNSNYFVMPDGKSLSDVGKSEKGSDITNDSSLKPVSKDTGKFQVAPGKNIIPKQYEKELTKDDNGNYLFFHYGDIKGDKIDPKHFGTKAYTTDSRDNGVSFYYTNLRSRESLVKGEAHVVSVPESKVYPFNKDPLNFYDKAKELFEKEHPGMDFSPAKQIDYMNPLIAKAGYDMTIAEWGNGLRAETVKPLKYDKKLSDNVRKTGDVRGDATSKLEMDVKNIVRDKANSGAGKINSKFYSRDWSAMEIMADPDLSKLIPKKLRDQFNNNKKAKFQVESLISGKDEHPVLKSTLEVAKFIEEFAKENKVFLEDIDLSRREGKTKKQTLKDKNISDQEFIDKLVDHLRKELKAWDAIHGSDYVGFYDRDIQGVLNPRLKEIHRELYGEDITPAETVLYHIMSAFASPSADPRFDSWKGFEVYDNYKRTGRITGYTDEQAKVFKGGEPVWERDPKTGKVLKPKVQKRRFNDQGNPVMSQISQYYSIGSLEKVNKVISHFNGDVKKTVDWLQSKHSFEEISKVTGFPIKNVPDRLKEKVKEAGGQTEKLKNHEYLSDKEGGYGIFGVTGVKLGSYILNRLADYSTVTKDLWYGRTMARLTGEDMTFFEKKKEEGKKRPVITEKAINNPWSLAQEGVKRRQLADKAFKVLADEAGTNVADIQQKLWDLEKRLWEKLGSNESRASASEGLEKGYEAVKEKQSEKVRVEELKRQQEAPIPFQVSDQVMSEADVKKLLGIDNKELEDIIKKRGSVRKVLTKISEMDNPHSAIASAILKHGDQESLNVKVGTTTSNISTYSGAFDRIKISNLGLSDIPLIIHEITHAFVVKKLPYHVRQGDGIAYKYRLDDYLKEGKDENVKGIIRAYIQAAYNLGYAKDLFGDTTHKKYTVGGVYINENKATFAFFKKEQAVEFYNSIRKNITDAIPAYKSGSVYVVNINKDSIGKVEGVSMSSSGLKGRLDFLGKEEKSGQMANNTEKFNESYGSPDRPPYGFKNINEFIAEAISNPDFQEKLNKIKSEDSPKTIWQNIVDAISRMMHLDKFIKKGVDPESVLDSVLRNSAEIINKSRPKDPEAYVKDPVNGGVEKPSVKDVPEADGAKFSVSPEDDTRSIQEKIDAEKMKGGTFKSAAKRFVSVEDTPKQAEDRKNLKIKIQSEVKAAREGYSFGVKNTKASLTDKAKSLQEMKNKVVSVIDKYRKDGDLKGVVPGRLLASAMRKLNQVKTEASMDKAIAYLDKIVSDKHYSEEIMYIRDLKSKVKNNLSRNKNTYGAFTDRVKEMLAIDETGIGFDKRSGDVRRIYLEALDDIVHNKVPDFYKANAAINLLRDINRDNLASEVKDDLFDSVSTAEKATEIADEITNSEIKSYDDYLEVKQKLSALSRQLKELSNKGDTDKATYQAVSDRVDKLQRDIDQKVSGDLKSEVDEVSRKLYEQSAYWIRDLNRSLFSADQNKAIDELFSINKETMVAMGIDKAFLVNKIAEQLPLGYLSPRAYDIISESKSIERADNIGGDIQELTAKEKPFFHRGGSKKKVIGVGPISVGSFTLPGKERSVRMDDYLVKLINAPKIVVDNLLSLGRKKTYFKNISYHLTQAYTHTERNIVEFNKRFHEASKKLTTALGFDKLDSRYKVGMILSQMDFKANHSNWHALDPSKKDVVGWGIKENLHSDHDGVNSSIIEQVYNSLPKDADGVMDVEAAVANLSIKEKKYLDTIRTILDELAPFNAASADRSGRHFSYEKEYFPRVTKSGGSTNFESFAEKFLNNAQNVSTKSSATFKRTQDLLAWRELDPNKVINSHIHDTFMDYHMSRPIKESMDALRMSKSVVTEKSGKAMIEALDRLTKEGLVTELASRAALDDEVKTLVDFLIRKSRPLVLSTPVRFIKEFIPNYLKFITSSGSFDNVKHLLPTFGEQEFGIQKLLYDVGSPVLLKQSRYEPLPTSGRESSISKAASRLSVYSDSVMARKAWVSSFNDAFKARTGDDFDFKKYKNDPEYGGHLAKEIEAAAQDALIGTESITGSQSAMTGAVKMKLNPFSRGRVENNKIKGFTDKGSGAGKLLGWMQHYNMFEFSVFSTNLRDVFTGENGSKAKAARMVSGVFLSNLAFTALSYYIGKSSGYIYSGNNEGQEKLLESMGTKEAQAKILATGISSLLLGGYGNSARLLLGGSLGVLDAVASSSNDSDFKDQVKDLSGVFKEYQYITPISFAYGGRSSSTARTLIQAVPAAGMYLTSAYDAVPFFTKIATGQDLNGEERTLYNGLLGLNAGMSLALPYPGMAEIQKVLRSQAQKAMMEAKNKDDHSKKKKNKDQNPDELTTPDDGGLKGVDELRAEPSDNELKSLP